MHLLVAVVQPDVECCIAYRLCHVEQVSDKVNQRAGSLSSMIEK